MSLLNDKNLAKLFNKNPFSFTEKEKEKVFMDEIVSLTKYHEERCQEYRNILKSYDFKPSNVESIFDIPFIHVRLFKEYYLKSINTVQGTKILSSSGTTNQKRSMIFLDKVTAKLQTLVLAKIINSVIGKSRMPMIIIDTEAVIKNRKSFSARGAGINGFSIFGRQKLFVLDEQMKLRKNDLLNFINEIGKVPILIFGFTYIIWEYFLSELEREKVNLDLSRAFLFHGGGWKRLLDKKLTNFHFSQKLKETCNIEKIHNYYGMAEQTGSIFLECEEGFMHCSVFSEIIIRNKKDLSVCSVGEKGIIQVMSLIPRSYPGHSIITEDEGELKGLSGCKCGRKGRFFKIYGRLEDVELRGCSDTYE